MHVIFKRHVNQNDFCGLESTISANDLDSDENAINEDVFVIGQRFTAISDLVVSFHAKKWTIKMKRIKRLHKEFRENK